MSKRLKDYVKYTVRELEQYTRAEGSCVRKVNTNLHVSMGPFCLADFRHALVAHIARSKVGFYDTQLDGIVLDVKKIKLLGSTGAMRADDARIHVNINADVYVFKPEKGAVVSGVVKHIGAHHVGVVLYRVFNANLRVGHKVDKDAILMEQEVKFSIRDYNLQNVFPYIDGGLFTSEGDLVKTKSIKKRTSFKGSDDSGIEEKEAVQELDELLSIIKTENLDEDEDFTPIKKSKRRSTDTSESIGNGTSKKKADRKRKGSTSLPSSIADSSEETILTPKKIKKETIKSEDEQLTPKKVKKEKSSKSKNKSPIVEVKIESSDEDDD